MTRSFFYYAGLVLTIMGLIGIISGVGTLWIRYFVLILGIALLIISLFLRSRY